jgi:hypothetical protein
MDDYEEKTRYGVAINLAMNSLAKREVQEILSNKKELLERVEAFKELVDYFWENKKKKVEVKFDD